jgi:adenosylcobinamide-GDP ribazoletransferase
VKRLLDGLRLALTTFTVAPVRAGRVDRATAGVAMALAPLIGGLLGAVLAGIGLAARVAGASPLLTAALTVALGVLFTRALHLDGLADTVDGLGSYKDAEGALAIMKRPDIGPFGVAAIVLVLLIQVAAATAAYQRQWPATLATVTAAVATGRLAATLACRRGQRAAREEGLGALVAGTVAGPWIVIGGIAVAAVATGAGRPWIGPIAVLAGLGASAILVRHATRRLGGITGDVLGATVEVATTVALAVLALADAGA